ncbi:MAG: segregation and condensation protein [Solirubrobacteraceae bacterium]|nr:segregation and condensation protein [Solirubrobacteraceae bacterium]
MLLAELELDLEVFSGPFDLLLTLVLRDVVDLLELQLAEVVVSYLDHLEARGELDLEAATEFIVLVAALLELKSRLMLPGEEEELLEFEPGEAAEELLARMLEARRYRGAAAHLEDMLAAQPEVRYRQAPLPVHLRRRSLEEAREGIWNPVSLGRALGGLLVKPARLDLRHLGDPRVTVAERIAHLRALLRGAASIDFDQAVGGADRITVAVTLFALLELYKQGEASWTQGEPFGGITIRAAGPEPAGR